MMKNDDMLSETQQVESFEVTHGAKSGDLLSEFHGERKLKVGLLACGYFEYWRMYKGLREQVDGDMNTIVKRLVKKHDVAYPGLVDTLDKANTAGKFFKEKHIDLLIVAEGTYCPDYLIHQALLHLPGDIPLCLYASQAHGKIDFNVGYDQALRNSGPMGIVQLGAGFRKMGKYEKYEAVVGAVDDDKVYVEIDRFIQVHTTIQNLRHWNIGLIGHVFRGMYDFQCDKTAVSGKLGPHIIDIDIKHLMTILSEIPEQDKRVLALRDKVHSTYEVVNLEEIDIGRSACLAIALQELVRRYKLNGLVLLGQHFIEQQANATCYLGLSELLSSDQALAVTEGDVLGVIISKILKDFTGRTPFFGEWEEIDTTLNAVMLLGHGFIDPREARKGRRIRVTPACEQWGFEGNSLGFEATYDPGPVTMSHIIQDANGWRMLISEGEILDTPSLRISESILIVQVGRDAREYFKDLLKFGFPHHSIAVPGHVAGGLELFTNQLDIEICRL